MYVCKTIKNYSNMCCGYCCLKKKKTNQKHKPVGNSESEGSCLTTVYPCGLLCDGGGGGRWDSGWCPGTRDLGGGHRQGGGPPTSLSPPEGVKKRRPESVEMAKLYTPLENQESMFKKRHKNLRGKKKSGEKCRTCLAL